MNSTDFRLAVFGSAFNPPHTGHVDVIKQVIDDYDRILLVPNAAHAFGKPMLNFDLRCHLLGLLVAEFFPHQPKVEISRIEALLHRQNPDHPVYTYHLLCQLKEMLPAGSEIHFVMGPDNAQPEKWQRFYRYQEIEKEFHLRVVEENTPVRSEAIRDICRTVTAPETRLQMLTPMCGKQIATYLSHSNLWQSE